MSAFYERVARFYDAETSEKVDDLQLYSELAEQYGRDNRDRHQNDQIPHQAAWDHLFSCHRAQRQGCQEGCSQKSMPHNAILSRRETPVH